MASPFDKPKTIAKANAGSKAKTVRKAVASTRAKAKAMVEETIAFISSHAVARTYLRRPEHTEPVIFPAGTWRHWRYYGAERKPVLIEGFAVP